MASLAGCVPAPPGAVQEDSNTLTSAVFPPLDPGGNETSGLHFSVAAYGAPRSKELLDLAEAQYARIMTDTGLYSFQPQGLYRIVVYGSADEFHRKTQFANWSAGLTVGNAIYSFDGPQLPGVLAHEMTHLIFNEFMTRSTVELRWVNEGLAVYEEATATGLRSLATFPRNLEPTPFDQMQSLVPATERERAVNLWYHQVGDVVGFMIERGGRIGFSQYLTALKDRRTMDESVRQGFPGIWSSLGEVEAAWKRTLSGR